MARVPFNRPTTVGTEIRSVAEAVQAGAFCGNGAFTRKCQGILERTLGAQRALLTTSCTDALEMAALLLDVREGDEVIVPSFTFVSTANAFVLRGATPVFADVRPDTLNLDETLLPELVTSRTKAIVPVHYAGVACEMDAICDFAARRGVHIVEDNAHGLFGSFRDRPLGTFGTFGTLSFHETKNFTCGEGGAILVNDPGRVQRAEVVLEKGTDRSRFFRGEIDKYTWVDVGSSYLPSDILAAFLFAQLEARAEIQRRRQQVWERYACHLGGWARTQGVSLPVVPGHCQQAYHLFYLLLPSVASRRALIEHLSARGIQSAFHYLPLHLSTMGRRFGGRPGGCPITEDVSDRLLRLPFYTGLAEADQDAVIEAVTAFSAG
jgi:dTDP-4-amino-4,6-dideoxygalactose transaminase